MHQAVRLPRFRVRTLIMAVGIVALLIWAPMMGSRSFVHYSLASRYSFAERVWREEAAKVHFRREGREECLGLADYYAQMAGKHRRAIWRPWLPVALKFYPRTLARQQMQLRRARMEGGSHDPVGSASGDL